MTEPSWIAALAAKYLARGYEVKVEPRPEDLPDFARHAGNVDLVARNGRETVLVQAKMTEADPDVFVAADLGGEYVRSMILEAEQLLRLDVPRAAFVMAWASFEAAARDMLRRAGRDADKMPPFEMIASLMREGQIHVSELDPLRRCLNLRNTIVHGVRPDSVPRELTVLLIDLARRLAAQAAGDTALRTSFSMATSATVFRARLNQAPGLKEKAAAADAILRSILNSSRPAISAEWDLGEDARQRPVVTLTLSDYTGTVTTTFTPEEMDDPEHMRFRLNRLWGDLLRIRSHKEIEGVVYMSGGAKVNG